MGLTIDLTGIDATDDGSMCRVDMTDPGLRASEPFGRFVEVERALQMEARGDATIRRKAALGKGEFEVTQEGRVMVEHLDEALIKSYGRYRSYLPEDASKGESVGKWRRCRKTLTAPEFRALGTDDIYGPGFKESTKNVKKKRVAWVQDNYIRGGAEISGELVIQIGQDCGWQIEVITPQIDKDGMLKILTGADVIVINNVWGFSGDQLQSIQTAIYSIRIPYIKYEHDHRELDRPEWSRRLFQQSRLNVFLSPIHLQNHKDRLGCGGIALPLAIDTKLFRVIDGVERLQGACLISNVRNFKTWVALQEYIKGNPDKQFTILGDEVVYGKNVTRMDKIPYENMPVIYNRFESVVHLLDGWGAGERVIFEGALCGCKIMANNRVGHMSWNRDLEDRDTLRAWLSDAPFEFWKQVEDATT